jgi:acyl-CoA reductase-like NAD-dependent aldehyde dehydrogenase
MAFQAGGSHAQDRGLEAVAFALAAMRRVPAAATWEKPQGKRPPLRMLKRYRIVPRGISLFIGCATFPTWNGYPGLFASLATGNPVLVKPSRRAVLPLAITVAVARDVLAEAGFSPDLVALTVDAPGDRSAADLALRPRSG